MRYAFLLSVLVVLSSIMHASQISGQNYSVKQANSTVAQAYAYVNLVNESGYLIFQPDLSASYGYLSNASSLYLSSPNVAVAYAQKAQQLAQEQYSSIGYYRRMAIPILVAFTILAALALFKVMIPVRKKNKRGRA